MRILWLFWFFIIKINTRHRDNEYFERVCACAFHNSWHIFFFWVFAHKKYDLIQTDQIKPCVGYYYYESYCQHQQIVCFFRCFSSFYTNKNNAKMKIIIIQWTFDLYFNIFIIYTMGRFNLQTSHFKSFDILISFSIFIGFGYTNDSLLHFISMLFSLFATSIYIWRKKRIPGNWCWCAHSLFLNALITNVSNKKTVMKKLL